MDSSDEKVEKVAKVLKKKEGEDKAGEGKFSFAPGFSTPTTTTVTTKPSVSIPLILPSDVPADDDTSPENLERAMKEEVVETATASCAQPRNPTISVDSSSSDDEFDLLPSSANNLVTHDDNTIRIGSRNEIYGYQFACKYIVTAHMGKHGPDGEEKVYDKEFISHLVDSLNTRSKRGKAGFSDPNLMCNRLDIHSVRLMRDKHSNRAKVFEYGNGGRGHFHVFVRVFTRAEIDAGLNTEEELLNWMERIRAAFCATRARYPFRLSIGQILGGKQAKTRALDRLLLDADVAEYARMIYGRKIAEGKFVNDVNKVLQFYSPWNAQAAKDLCG